MKGLGRPRRHPRTGQRGQSVAELAMVTPLLVLLLMGTVDLGRVIFAYIALEDAVQEGAIYMAHEPTPFSTVIYRVQSSSNHPEVTGAVIDPATDIQCTLPASGTPGSVSVRATYALPLITPVVRAILGDTVTLTAKFTGTNFRGNCS